MTLRLPQCEVCGGRIWPVPQGRRPRAHYRCEPPPDATCAWCGRREPHPQRQCAARARRSEAAVRAWMRGCGTL